jgi:hypothetical protein
MTRTAWQICGAAILLAVVWAHGMTKGKAWVQADWDKATVAAERAAQAAAQAQRDQANAAAKDFETKRTRLATELQRTRGALSVALRTSLSCEPTGDGHVPTLADVPVPAAAVDRLRIAATGPAAD